MVKIILISTWLFVILIYIISILEIIFVLSYIFIRRFINKKFYPSKYHILSILLISGVINLLIIALK